jgi:MoxR-like ATPase
MPPSPGPDAAIAVAGRLHAALASVVLGGPDALELTVAAAIAGGHVLVEDVPGVGKTLLGKALAAAVGGTFGRVQGTADLLPTDVTGVSVYQEGTGTWLFRPGPVFHHVVLVDELNRATPRAQSALLEAMAEGQVTVDGAARPLPRPFVVLATQNPGGPGTFPLVEGQLDRFAVSVSLGLPPRDAERALLAGDGGVPALEHLAAVTTPAGLAAARDGVAAVHVAAPVVDYLLDVVGAVRAVHGGTRPSPRASQALLGVAQALACLDGRAYTTPEDVQRAAPAVLAHRVAGGPGALDAARAEIERLVTTVAVPVG